MSGIRCQDVVIVVALGLGMSTARAGEQWLHPAGMVSRETVREMREKCRRTPWARAVRDGLVRGVQPWVDIPMERLRQVTPKRRANVYHLFSCPEDKARLKFEAFSDGPFTCPRCGKVYPPDTDPGIYPKGNPYHGTMYDGWACLYFQSISQACWRLGLAYTLTGQERYARRAAEILLLFADLTPTMPRMGGPGWGGWPVIFTYNTEGEFLLLEFAGGYELVRDAGVLTPEQKRHVERDLLKAFCDDVFRSQVYDKDWNNVYWWHLVIMQVGCALEDRDYLDFSLGLGKYSPERMPEHRSLAYMTQHHFKPDGAFYELCSGYHLYMLGPLLRAAVLGHSLARQQPGLFPPGDYDCARRDHPIGAVAHRALRWYTALTLPDSTMAMLGDAMMYRDSLRIYDPCGEIGYRYFGVGEAAWEPGARENRGLWGLLYGATQIQRKRLPFESAYLSSGFAALRSEYRGSRAYAGINALKPGDMHQHADRLELITYACDRLLGLEKGNPYNDPALGQAGKESYSHNTVTVDRVSQRRGDLLKGDEIPRVRYFQSNAEVQLAEAWGDRIYPQTARYRRMVALLDDVVVDLFDVAGGRVHDWLYHCGGALELGLPAEERQGFEPAVYLLGGSPAYRHAVTDAAWTATWTLAPEVASTGEKVPLGKIVWAPSAADPAYPGRLRTVFHRLTMLGAPGTEVHHLQTYPVQQPGELHPKPTQSVLARRTGSDAPFVSALETYYDQPAVQSFEALPVSLPGAAAAKLVSHGVRRVLLYNPDPRRPLRVQDGSREVTLAGHLAILRLDGRGTVVGAVLLDATDLSYGSFAVQAPRAANLCLRRRGDSSWEAAASADVAYETLTGERVHGACEDVALRLHAGGKALPLRAKGHAAKAPK